jgi:hypothetical protein
VGVCSITVAVCQHSCQGDGNLPKPSGGLRVPLHSGNCCLRVVHLVVVNTKELCRNIDRIRAPGVVQSTARVLVIDVSCPVVDQGRPFVAPPGVP